MVIRSGLVSMCFVLASSNALAQEAPYAPHDSSVIVVPRNNQLSVYGTGALGVFGRESGNVSGGEAAYVLGGLHGFRVGYLYGAGVFGPEVHMVDLDYSVQWTSKRWRGKLWGDVGALLGPALGVVSYGGNQPDVHATFGGRAGVFADAHFYWLTLGADGSYRFGFSSDYGAEVFASIGLHLGVTLDI